MTVKIDKNNAADAAQGGYADKQMKTTLVINTIQKKCEESNHLILQQINYAINDFGATSKLNALVLTGGFTNYSYKIFVDNHLDLCVFAKLMFDSAPWNPDKNARFDLARTQNEYNIMKEFSEVDSDSCVANPLACWNVEQDGEKMKLLVTEWSEGTEQFANQFIDGCVDPRIAPKLSSTLMKLHTMKFDPNFNKEVQPYIKSMNQVRRRILIEMASNDTPKDRTESYCRMLGKDIIMNIIDASSADENKCESLQHHDPHVFNVLVEAKPSVEESQSFGPNGNVVLCDWEFARAGPLGYDAGLVLTWPIVCVMAHALSGNEDGWKNVAIFVENFMSEYMSKMIELGKTPGELSIIYRRIVAQCGWFCFSAFYVNGCFIDESPCRDKALLRDSLGTFALKAMRFGYDNDFLPQSTDLDELRSIFDFLLDMELKSLEEERQKRKSSLLRASVRRISDATLMEMDKEPIKQ